MTGVVSPAALSGGARTWRERPYKETTGNVAGGFEPGFSQQNHVYLYKIKKWSVLLTNGQYNMAVLHREILTTSKGS